MAHSIQVVDEKVEIFNDWGLLAVIALAIREVGTHESLYAEILPLIAIPAWAGAR